MLLNTIKRVQIWYLIYLAYPSHTINNLVSNVGILQLHKCKDFYV